MNEVLLNKAGIIERCLRRIAEEYAGDPARLRNLTHQDAADRLQSFGFALLRMKVF